jgi:hypothetical protein
MEPESSPLYSMEPDATFHLQLELEQMQAKVRLLAGGTDGEQLAEVLLDREEELRAKESDIIELSRKLQTASSDLLAFEADRGEYEVGSSTVVAKLVSITPASLLSIPGHDSGARSTVERG